MNALVPELKRQGIETIIVLLHEGGSVGGSFNTATINSCTNPTGALPPIVEAMDDEIDIVITGHTNWAVNCLIDGKVVTGAAHLGRLITDIDLTISRATKDVVGPILVNNRIVTQEVTKAADMTALIAKYNVFAGPIAARVVGNITGPLTRTTNPPSPSEFDHCRVDHGSADRRCTAGVVARCGGPDRVHESRRNAGRPCLRSTRSRAGDAWRGVCVQPFSNIVTTKTFTGQQIKDDP